jgi:hypothetical protein
MSYCSCQMRTRSRARSRGAWQTVALEEHATTPFLLGIAEAGCEGKEQIERRGSTGAGAQRAQRRRSSSAPSATFKRLLSCGLPELHCVLIEVLLESDPMPGQ